MVSGLIRIGTIIITVGAIIIYIFVSHRHIEVREKLRGKLKELRGNLERDRLIERFESTRDITLVLIVSGAITFVAFICMVFIFFYGLPLALTSLLLILLVIGISSRKVIQKFFKKYITLVR